SEVASLQGIQNGNAVQDEKQLLHKTWTISSVNELQALRIQVLGVVFVDYDATLEPVVLTKTTDISDFSVETNVARIVVTGDSSELIDFFQVVPLEDEKNGQGVSFRPKYQNADLQGTLLTQISVSRKAMLRYFCGQVGDFVIGDDVLVQNDPEVDIVLLSLWSGSIFLKLKNGFDVHSLEAMQGGCGTFQLHVPSIHTRKGVSFTSAGEQAKLVIVSDHDILSPDRASFMSMMEGNILVQTPKFTTDILAISGVLAGAVRFLGHGSVKKEVVIVGGPCAVDTKAIVAEDAMIGISWSAGDITVQATNKLNMGVIGAGPASVAYAGARPTVLNTKQYFRWSRPVVQQAIPTEDHIPVELYKLLEPPMRVPKQFHIRVTKSSMFSGRNIELVDNKKMQPKSHWGMKTALVVGGAAAATAVTLLVIRRR
uniref:Uncharacterized protein n=1 Tax=Globisporangium ultimum (strain ATCC 200006 / CBS 805.95 / DAOM BR144) TaxID=431595 RepID=K3XCG8_GLOUD